MNSPESIRIHEETPRETVEHNLKSLCLFCFEEHTIYRIYNEPTLKGRLAKAYRLLGGSAEVEFKSFDLPIPREVWYLRPLVKRPYDDELYITKGAKS